MSQWQDWCDNATTTAGLLGLDVSQFPYISGYGLLLRAVRINCFGRKDLYTVFGIRAAQDIDLLQACHRPGRPRTRLEASFGLERSPLTNHWREEMWCPITIGDRWKELHHRVRHCPVCLRYGYHCALFQMPFVHTCPWHSIPLRDTCESCERPHNGHLTAGSMGVCECGHDPVDVHLATAQMRSFPAAEAQALLEPYLMWCDAQRAERHLVSTGPPAAWYVALPALAAPFGQSPNGVTCPNQANPRVFHWRSTGVRLRAPSIGAFWSWVVLGTAPTVTIAPLPKVLHRPLMTVTRAVVARFPKKTRLLVDPHRMTKPPQTSVHEVIRSRPHHFVLPFGSSLRHGAWLNLSAVSPRALELCGQLVETVDRMMSGPSVATARTSVEVEKCRALDRIEGRGCVQKALFHVLLRGFALGLNVVLRRNLTERSQPFHPIDDYVPVAELAASGGQIRRVSVTWVRRTREGGHTT